MEVQALPPIINMEIIEIEQKKMDALKSLSDISMEISETQANLIKVKLEESTYFADREKEMSQRVGILLEESQGVIGQTYQNYLEVRVFCHNVFNFSEKVTSFLKDLLAAQELFEKREEEFKIAISKEEERLYLAKRELNIQKIDLESEKTGLITREKELVKQETKAKDLLEELQRGIKRLKEGRI